MHPRRSRNVFSLDQAENPKQSGGTGGSQVTQASMDVLGEEEAIFGASCKFASLWVVLEIPHRAEY